jgi:REP element-mobilizing transposase RayT
MVMKWWKELGNKFTSVLPDEAVVMPNHFHGIIVIVGAALCGRPPSGRPHRGAATLPLIMDWFKTMTTNEYIRGVKEKNWPRFAGKLWQRSYYDHIIRNEQDLHGVRAYIMNNPAQWTIDGENPERTNPPGRRTGS